MVDTEGMPVTDAPLYEGSKGKLNFYQKPYILKDGVTYGSSLKLVGVQVVSLNSEAGVDTGDSSRMLLLNCFGKYDGFKTTDPNVTPTTSTIEEDD